MQKISIKGRGSQKSELGGMWLHENNPKLKDDRTRFGIRVREGVEKYAELWVDMWVIIRDYQTGGSNVLYDDKVLLPANFDLWTPKQCFAVVLR